MRGVSQYHGFSKWGRVSLFGHRVNLKASYTQEALIKVGVAHSGQTLIFCIIGIMYWSVKACKIEYFCVVFDNLKFSSSRKVGELEFSPTYLL